MFHQLSDGQEGVHPDRWMLISAALFIALFFVTALVCTSVWNTWVVDHLYNCTDSLGLDYLHPGDWVHNPVEVDRVGAANSMSHQRDTIKKGWSVFDLWLLWFSFLAVSVAVSASPGFVYWIYKRQGHKIALAP